MSVSRRWAEDYVSVLLPEVVSARSVVSALRLSVGRSGRLLFYGGLLLALAVSLSAPLLLAFSCAACVVLSTAAAALTLESLGGRHLYLVLCACALGELLQLVWPGVRLPVLGGALLLWGPRCLDARLLATVALWLLLSAGRLLLAAPLLYLLCSLGGTLALWLRVRLAVPLCEPAAADGRALTLRRCRTSSSFSWPAGMGPKMRRTSLPAISVQRSQLPLAVQSSVNGNRNSRLCPAVSSLLVNVALRYLWLPGAYQYAQTPSRRWPVASDGLRWLLE
ncbi:uncharacterized protein LOC119108075 [Pollicipes pollicipes]|uniref:uncharacterized protein LOC119108075 n=1 Tax=Pollicipes pollicipes TaxID=41117 RepID=UPI00188553A1|nr:uncharacterized protein LOC119108075 [Pollicipes pollicipes]